MLKRHGDDESPVSGVEHGKADRVDHPHHRLQWADHHARHSLRARILTLLLYAEEVCFSGFQIIPTAIRPVAVEDQAAISSHDLPVEYVAWNLRGLAQPRARDVRHVRAVRAVPQARDAGLC